MRPNAITEYQEILQSLPLSQGDKQYADKVLDKCKAISQRQSLNLTKIALKHFKRAS